MLAEYHHCQHLIETAQQLEVGKRIDLCLLCCPAAVSVWMPFHLQKKIDAAVVVTPFNMTRIDGTLDFIALKISDYAALQQSVCQVTLTR